MLRCRLSSAQDEAACDHVVQRLPFLGESCHGVTDAERNKAGDDFGKMTARGAHEGDALARYVCNDQAKNLLTGGTLPFRAFQECEIEPRAKEAESDTEHQEEREGRRHAILK